MSMGWQFNGKARSVAVLALAGLGIAGAVGLNADPAIASPLMICASFLLLVCWSWGVGYRLQTGIVAGGVGAAAVALGLHQVGTSLFGLASSLVSLAGLTLGFRWLMGADSTDGGSAPASRSSLLKGMARASALHDYQIGDHGERVAEYCVVVGAFLGMPECDLRRLEWAARLHDVGKVAIPRTILKKPGSLTPAETIAVQQHSALGADIILAAEPAFAPIARVVRHHHERWDGTGYPVGLRGEAIPLESRVIAVVDMYEALISDRPYRKAIAPAAAREEILARSGTQFDPDVVAIFDAVWMHGSIGGFAAGELTVGPEAVTVPMPNATEAVMAAS